MVLSMFSTATKIQVPACKFVLTETQPPELRKLREFRRDWSWVNTTYGKNAPSKRLEYNT